MDLFDLFCKISIDDSGFTSGIENAKSKVQETKQKLTEFGTAVKNAGKTFAAIGAGVAAAGGAMFAFASNVSLAGDNIDKMSQKLGISAEAYQEWDFILTHAGTSIEGLQTSMKTLANAAVDGSDSTTAAFKKLGLSMEEVSAMSQEDLFSAVITGLQEMEEGTERTAVAADLLGRSATELGPVFNMSAEETEALRQQIHDLGGVMSDEAVKNSAAFQDALTDLKTAFSGASNSLTAELLPNLTGMMNNVAEFIAGGGLQNLIDGFTNLSPVIAAATAAMVAYKAASAIASVITALTKATEGQTIAQIALNAVMNANPFVLVATAVAALATGIMALWTTNEDFRNAVINIWDNITSVVTGAVEKVQGAIGGVVDGIKNLLGIHTDLVSALEGMEEQTTNASQALNEQIQTLAESEEQTEGLTASTEGLISILEELEKSTLSTVGASGTLTAALKEQEASGSLSLETANELIEAGYRSALIIDQETGAVTLNREEYVRLANAKIQEQIATLESTKANLESKKALDEATAAANRTGSAYWDAAKAKAALEYAGDAQALDLQIAALNRAHASLTSYSSAVTTAAISSSSASRKIKTQAERDLEDYKSLKADLDHQKNMDLVDEANYYRKLGELRDRYLTDMANLSEYNKVSETLYKADQQALASREKLWRTAGENILKLEEDFQNELVGRAGQITNSYKLFDEIPERQKVSGDQLLKNLNAQIDSIGEFYSNIKQLAERGVGDKLVEEIRSMGVGAADQLTALLSLSDEKLEEYASLYQEKQDLANSIALEELAGLRIETNTEIMSQLNSLEALYDEYAPQIGMAFTDGLAQGIKNGISTVVEASTNAAETVVEAVRSVLGIHSPSRVFAGIGENMALGLGEGWMEEFNRVKRDITNGMDFGTANVDFASSGLGVSSAGIINSVANGGMDGAVIPLTLNIMFPDGTKFATWLLPDLIKVAAANGTPIANGQVG